MYLSDRMPFDVRMGLMAGTLSWERLPMSDRFYYQTGARGGSLVHDPEEAELSAGESVGLRSADYDAALEAYCNALDADRAARGLPPLPSYEDATVTTPEQVLDVPAPVVGAGQLATAQSTVVAAPVLVHAA